MEQAFAVVGDKMTSKYFSERLVLQDTTLSRLDESFRVYVNLRKNFASRADYKKLIIMATRNASNSFKKS